LTLRICLRAAKQLDTVLETCIKSHVSKTKLYDMTMWQCCWYYYLHEI